MQAERCCSVCIIGCGLSGITAAVEALDSGFDVTMFDTRDGFGGLFNNEAAANACDDGQSTRAYDDMHLTISNTLMAFSSHPCKGPRRFWTRGDYVEYLAEMVAAKRVLEQADVRLTTEVVSVEENGGGPRRENRATGAAVDGGAPSYTVRTRDLRTGAVTDGELFDAVAVCTGSNRRPRIPAIDGLASFAGPVMHSFNYVSSEEEDAVRFQGKRVAVVGFGESGADITRRVSAVAGRMVLCLRSHPFVVQRLLHDETKYTVGEPSDSVTSPAHHLLYRGTATWLLVLGLAIGVYIHEQLTRLWQALVGRIESTTGGEQRTDAFGQCRLPDHRPMMDMDAPWNAAALALQREWNSHSAMRTFATKNFSAAKALVRASSVVNVSGIARVKGGNVIFNDGLSEQVDVIILNTGYVDDFSFLPSALRPSSPRALFKNAFPLPRARRRPGAPPGTTSTQRPGLAFIGWARPSFGGVPVCSEMVARYWMQLLKGERALPLDAAVTIEEDQVKYRALYPKALNTPTLVDLYLFMDELAALIDCRPHLGWCAMTDWRLVWKYLFGQHVGNWYRLRGPGSDFETHAAIIRELPVCLVPLNVVKHACANLLNSAMAVPPSDRFKLVQWFDL